MSGLQVQLCETRRELQELKASLKLTQKEKEQLLAEKQVGGIVWFIIRDSLNFVFSAKGLLKRLPCMYGVTSTDYVPFSLSAGKVLYGLTSTISLSASFQFSMFVMTLYHLLIYCYPKAYLANKYTQYTGIVNALWWESSLCCYFLSCYCAL